MQKQYYPITYYTIPRMPRDYPITAEVIEDSVSKYNGKRITTLQLEYPRYVHSEHLKHREQSISASSSRAIPSSKLIAHANKKIVTPVRWGKNQPGMQPSMDSLTGEDLDLAKELWINLAERCTEVAAELSRLGLHKQWANRCLEWFSTIKVVMTATEFDNFLGLRDHYMAQEEMAHLTQAIKDAMNASTPRELGKDEFHLPYLPLDIRDAFSPLDLCKMSSACCARTSYMNHGGGRSSEDENLALFDKLKGVPPDLPHATPFEHQATPDTRFLKIRPLTGNFKGWIQFRKILQYNLKY